MGLFMPDEILQVYRVKNQKTSPVGTAALKSGREGKGQGSAGLPEIRQLFPALKCYFCDYVGNRSIKVF